MDANFYPDPDLHGCELLPGSGSTWMRTFTWIRIRIQNLENSICIRFRIRNESFVIHNTACKDLLSNSVAVEQFFKAFFYIFRTGRISRMGCLMTIVMACLSIWAGMNLV